MFILSIVLITLALVFYTIGAWSERIQGELKWWQVGAFALGFAADTSGTLLMSAIARSDGPSGLEGSPILAQLMAVSGAVALVLMGLHLAWAVVVMIRNKPAEKASFHKFSLVVWAIWLVPYFTGAIAAMA
ncbi:HsmA family protein [Schaalia sp. JY-X159]|uniref:HsmA family protein n=1 Tax=Schaalia sp. JY-X159 TaxID=2758575 RepID=UPI00165E5ED6|nr:HsmA family protein [Schaalia sp. JY-X159]